MFLRRVLHRLIYSFVLRSHVLHPLVLLLLVFHDRAARVSCTSHSRPIQCFFLLQTLTRAGLKATWLRQFVQVGKWGVVVLTQDAI